ACSSSICQLAAGEVECLRCVPRTSCRALTGCGKLVSVNPKPPTKGGLCLDFATRCAISSTSTAHPSRAGRAATRASRPSRPASSACAPGIDATEPSGLAVSHSCWRSSFDAVGGCQGSAVRLSSGLLQLRNVPNDRAQACNCMLSSFRLSNTRKVIIFFNRSCSKQ
uniref:Secreted protein n=1 Tax=Macrostomum lignano TaxID=282301 RepID=A0A1I8F551_9PLAT